MKIEVEVEVEELEVVEVEEEEEVVEVEEVEEKVKYKTFIPNNTPCYFPQFSVRMYIRLLFND